MRAVALALVSLAIALMGWAWLGGGLERLGLWAAGHQRDFQNEIALGLRGMRAGRDGAFWLLMGLCFAYGFFHAVGPGHGKVLIGGYGLGRGVPALRLSVIGLLASLGQAVTAIALVYGGLWLFSLGREDVTALADETLARFSYAAICLVGGWLLLRGLRRLVRRPVHVHHDGGHCESCGHRHGPTLEEVNAVSGPWAAFALIAGIAIRPCTGALFVLIITWQMGIGWAGVAGAFAMALGTGMVTVVVGLGAVGLRGGVLRGLEGATRVVPVVEITAGLVIIALSGGLLLRL